MSMIGPLKGLRCLFRLSRGINIRFHRRNPPIIRHGRFSSSISIAATATNETKPATEPTRVKVSPDRSIDHYLAKYRELFPLDKIINAQINTILKLKHHRDQSIRVGVIYASADESRDCKVIETLLADPLSKDSKNWFESVENRDRSINNVFQYGSAQEPARDEDVRVIHKIPSPILSSVHRPSFMCSSVLPTVDLHLWELNDTSILEKKPETCHFYILVTNSLIERIRTLPNTTSDLVGLTAIDNSEYSPHSTENTEILNEKLLAGGTHLVKIDTNLAYLGIQQFYQYDTKASSEYLESAMNSNMYELLKRLGWYLTPDNLCNFLLKRVLSGISGNVSETTLIEQLYKSIQTHDIPNFSNAVHSELQNSMIPETNNFFKRKLRWWNLYSKNDNVEYDLKDFFSKKFLPSSIENFNYLRGKIISKMQAQEHFEYPGENTLNNPLLEMRNTLVNERLSSEVQPVVYSSISGAFIHYQLPITLLSIFAYQYFDFSTNASIALALFGWVVGFNNMSKTWEKFTRAWLSDLYEEARIKISKDCIDSLVQELDNKYAQEINIAQQKQEIVRALTLKQSTSSSSS